MKPLRVLHFVPSFVGGGAERQLSYLALSLAELGHEVHIGFLHDGPNLQRLQGTAVQLHRLPAAGNHDPRLLLRTGDLIRRVRPDVVQTWLLQMDVFAGAAARIAGVPWILAERCSAEMYSSGWKNRLRRVLGRGSDAIVANSAVGLEYWRDVPNRNHHRMVRNIVPVDAITATTGLPQDAGDLLKAPELIVAAGRLHEQKNWLVYFAALRTVLNARPQARAVVFGEGPLEAPLRQLASSYECADRIHLRGYVGDLWRWLKHASVYVSASRYEGTPNVVLEAVACKSPLVLSDIQSHREILSAEQAEFVALESAADIAAGIVRVLDDRARFAARAERAYEAVSNWSGASIAREYAELYRELSVTKRD
jgi:glycosyltransferase involved in cell wall biosynthesis